LGVFGGKDKHAGFSDVASAEAAAAKIRAAGGSIELHVAPGGVHGFFNQLAPGGLELTASECVSGPLHMLYMLCMFGYICELCLLGVGFREEVVGLVHGCTCVGARWGKLPRMRCYCVA
jgi:hypothetical protein